MIKEFRKKHNLTQTEFGKLVGLAQPSISWYESKEATGLLYELTDGHRECIDYIRFRNSAQSINSMYKKVQEMRNKVSESELSAPTLPEKKDRSVLSILFGWIKRWLGL